MKQSFCCAIILFWALASASPLAYAQTKTDETTEQREFSTEDKMEDLFRKPQTVDEIIKLLKERADAKIKEKRRKQLLKFKVSTSELVGFETNPLNDEDEKSDFYVEEDLDLSWQPTFTEHFSGNFGYRLANQSYFEQTDVSTLDHVFSSSLKYYPFWESHQMYIQPGAEYEWLNYPKDESASYEDTRAFIKFRHYWGKEWHWGGKYELSHKVYATKLARNENKENISGVERTDFRNTVELYFTKYIGKWSVKLRGKLYRNNSNDDYQKYYDFDGFRGYVTLAGSFLNDKLYVTVTPDFEKKSYHRRIVVNTAREDRVMNYRIDMYYTMSKDWELSYSFTNKYSSSSASGGEFDNMTNSIGVTYSF